MRGGGGGSSLGAPTQGPVAQTVHWGRGRPARNPASNQGPTGPTKRLRHGGQPQELTGNSAVTAGPEMLKALGSLTKQPLPFLRVQFPRLQPPPIATRSLRRAPPTACKGDAEPWLFTPRPEREPFGLFHSLRPPSRHQDRQPMDDAAKVFCPPSLISLRNSEDLCIDLLLLT